MCLTNCTLQHVYVRHPSPSFKTQKRLEKDRIGADRMQIEETKKRERQTKPPADTIHLTNTDESDYTVTVTVFGLLDCVH